MKLPPQYGHIFFIGVYKQAESGEKIQPDRYLTCHLLGVRAMFTLLSMEKK
jgi:hypothetical protein